MTSLRIEPLSTIEPTRSTARPTARTIDCPHCGKLFLATAVVNGEATFDRIAGGQVVSRSLHCDGCGVISNWMEGAYRHDGRWHPNGVVVGPINTISCRRKISKFLAQHPEATGVLDVLA